MTNYAENSGESAAGAPSGQGHGHWPAERLEDRHVPHRGSPHGKPSSWALVATVVAAFLAGGSALITHLWWLFWACAGIVVIAIPVGKAIGIMNDTVAWGSNPAAGPEPPAAGQPEAGVAPARRGAG
jgi:hypothetical protein